MQSFRLNVGPTIPPGKRLPVLDELKGIALMLVILYHSGGVLGLPNTYHGELGVDIFLMVSGFTLALSSTTSTLGEFVRRRFFRIYPAYWLALGLFLYFHRKYFGSVYSLDNIIQHFVGIHGFSRLAYFSAISDSFWFISMIVAAYVVFVCVRRHLDNLSMLIGLCGLLTTVATVTYQHFGHAGGLISLAVRIPSFFLGLVAGRLLSAGTAEVRLNFSLGLGVACFYYLTFLRGITCNYVLPAAGIILLWVAIRWALDRVKLGRVVLWPVGMLGLISYEMYLFHQPLIRDYNRMYLFRKYGILNPTYQQLELGIFVALGISLIISVIVHLLTRALFGGMSKRRVSVAVAPA
jgi:peptidoglycan/LPS O-acetylase OafA/YrhL